MFSALNINRGIDMTADELKAIRARLGLTQTAFAAQLGMTSTYVGMMEREERPIERRTALAAQHLDEHPDAVALNLDEIDAPEGSFFQRIVDMLQAEETSYAPGGLETYTIQHTGGGPFMVTLRIKAPVAAAA
jgi:transcriptional regulator with XRE-family HTH domain